MRRIGAPESAVISSCDLENCIENHFQGSCTPQQEISTAAFLGCQRQNIWTISDPNCGTQVIQGLHRRDLLYRKERTESVDPVWSLIMKALMKIFQVGVWLRLWLTHHFVGRHEAIRQVRWSNSRWQSWRFIPPPSVSTLDHSYLSTVLEHLYSFLFQVLVAALDQDWTTHYIATLPVCMNSHTASQHNLSSFLLFLFSFFVPLLISLSWAVRFFISFRNETSILGKSSVMILSLLQQFHQSSAIIHNSSIDFGNLSFTRILIVVPLS